MERETRMVDFKALAAPFPKEKISWRVGSVSKDKKKAMVLAYLDARDVMERLDTVCGPQNWQSTHPHANGKTSCKIGINTSSPEEIAEWVWKENGCGDSQVEAEKGAFSDSFKRAAVLWGIGRYLYDVPTVWVEIDEYKQIKNPNDSRLGKALDAAAKGIRMADEIEPTPIPLTEDEFHMVKTTAADSKSMGELEAAKEKASLVKTRMTPQQQKEVGAIINAKTKSFGALAA